MVERLAALGAQLLKVGRGEAGLFFELVGKVLYAAVSQTVGNFRK